MDPNSNTPGGSNPPTPPSLPEAIEINGKKVPLAEVIKAVQETAQLRQQNEDLSKKWNAALRATDPNLRAEEQEDAIRTFFAAKGLSEAEIQRIVDQAQEANPEPGEEDVANDPDPTTVRRNSAHRQSDELDNYTKALEQRVESLEAFIKETRKDTVKHTLGERISKVLDNDPNIRLLLDTAKKRSGDQGETSVQTLRDSLRSQIQDRAMQLLSERARATAGPIPLETIGDVVTKAVAKVYESVKPLVGTVPDMGQTSSLPPDLQRLAKSKPVPPPSHDPKKTLSDTQEDLKNFAADSLTRLMLEEVSGTPAKSVV